MSIHSLICPWTKHCRTCHGLLVVLAGVSASVGSQVAAAATKRTKISMTRQLMSSMRQKRNLSTQSKKRQKMTSILTAVNASKVHVTPRKALPNRKIKKKTSFLTKFKSGPKIRPKAPLRRHSQNYSPCKSVKHPLDTTKMRAFATRWPVWWKMSARISNTRRRMLVKTKSTKQMQKSFGCTKISKMTRSDTMGPTCATFCSWIDVSCVSSWQLLFLQSCRWSSSALLAALQFWKALTLSQTGHLDQSATLRITAARM